MFGSQGFGMTSLGGMDSQPTQAVAADKKPRQEAKDVCLPVTIRAIDAAVERRGETGEDLKFYGCVEPQMILLVAAVETVNRQATSLEVTLNDATGRVKGRWFLTEPQEGELDSIVPGSFVSAFGEVRTSPVKHIALKGMRPVESADEVSYHMIEAAHAMLKLTNPGGRKEKEPTTPAPKKKETINEEEEVASSAAKALTPEKPQQQVVEPVVAMEVTTTKPSAPAAPSAKAGPPAGAELRAAVLAILREASMGPEGLQVDAIAQRAGVAAASELKAILNELLEDGELYNTITEEHFAAV